MEQDPTYIKGFNSGYKLAEYNPELWEKLKPSLSNENDFERGVLEGAQEYEKNKEKTRENDLDNIRNKENRSLDQNLNR